MTTLRRIVLATIIRVAAERGPCGGYIVIDPRWRKRKP